MFCFSSFTADASMRKKKTNAERSRAYRERLNPEERAALKARSRQRWKAYELKGA